MRVFDFGTVTLGSHSKLVKSRRRRYNNYNIVLIVIESGFS